MYQDFKLHACMYNVYILSVAGEITVCSENNKVYGEVVSLSEVLLKM